MTPLLKSPASSGFRESEGELLGVMPRGTPMKAIRLHARGGLESLRFEDAQTPRPSPGEILVRGSGRRPSLPTELLWAALTWETRNGGSPAAAAGHSRTHEFSGGSGACSGRARHGL